MKIIPAAIAATFFTSASAIRLPTALPNGADVTATDAPLTRPARALLADSLSDLDVTFVDDCSECGAWQGFSGYRGDELWNSYGGCVPSGGEVADFASAPNYAFFQYPGNTGGWPISSSNACVISLYGYGYACRGSMGSIPVSADNTIMDKANNLCFLKGTTPDVTGLPDDLTVLDTIGKLSYLQTDGNEETGIGGGSGLSILMSLGERFNLIEDYLGDGAHTIFAPTDLAWQRFVTYQTKGPGFFDDPVSLEEAVAYIAGMSDDELRPIVLNHLVEGYLSNFDHDLSSLKLKARSGHTLHMEPNRRETADEGYFLLAIDQCMFADGPDWLTSSDSNYMLFPSSYLADYVYSRNGAVYLMAGVLFSKEINCIPGVEGAVLQHKGVDPCLQLDKKKCLDHTICHYVAGHGSEQGPRQADTNSRRNDYNSGCHMMSVIDRLSNRAMYTKEHTHGDVTKSEREWLHGMRFHTDSLESMMCEEAFTERDCGRLNRKRTGGDSCDFKNGMCVHVPGLGDLGGGGFLG